MAGGIAAYKSAELTRRLIKSGAEVKVIMTRNASRIYYPSHITDIDRSSRFHQYVFFLTEKLALEIGHIALAEYPDPDRYRSCNCQYHRKGRLRIGR